MSGFIFCLIFIQVSIFLGAGVVFFSTFFLNNHPHAQPMKVIRMQKITFTDVSQVKLTRSEIEYLLGA